MKKLEKITADEFRSIFGRGAFNAVPPPPPSVADKAKQRALEKALQALKGDQSGWSAVEKAADPRLVTLRRLYSYESQPGEATNANLVREYVDLKLHKTQVWLAEGFLSYRTGLQVAPASGDNGVFSFKAPGRNPG